MKRAYPLGALVLLIAFAVPRAGAVTLPRVIEIIADKDNRFKMPGSMKAVITAHPKEVLLLKVTSRKGTEIAKDGAVHSLTIKELKDQGWDVRLKEGSLEITLVAPANPGEYTIECAVKCGEGHDDMRMKLIVQ